LRLSRQHESLALYSKEEAPMAKKAAKKTKKQVAKKSPAKKVKAPVAKKGTAKAAASPKKKPAGSPAPGSTAKAVGASGLHVVRAGEQIAENVEGHAARADSPEFVSARNALHKILAEVKQQTGKPFYYGDQPVQAHHGGSIWVHDGSNWRMYQNLAGIEWSGQFAADPQKVDVLRQNAKALVDRFPATLGKLKDVGYTDAEKILNTQITDMTGVSLFVDSLFNACVPLPQPVHTGAITATNARAAGKHTYPTPNDDTLFFCRDDFQPFVYEPKSKATYTVAPIATSGPDARKVRVLGVHTESTNPVHIQRKKAIASGKALVLDASDPIAKKAFGDGS
jgi:hypothetical protein